MEKGHILKFVIKGKTFDENVGIKTYPQQTYGVSQQSPQHFKQKHTLIGDNGYLYKYENHPSYCYPSQRKSYNIHQEIDEEDYTKLHIKLMENSMAFHRKKGRLSQFMDKNGWMAPVVPIMGFQRTEKARFFSNRDRQERIKSLKPKKVYEPKVRAVKVNQEYFNTISTLMSQKLKIRKQRNDLNQQSKIQQSARGISQKKQYADPIHIESIRETMAKTKNDFYSTSSTFYNRIQVLREQSRTQMHNGQESPSKQSFRSSISKRGISPVKSTKQPTNKIKANPQDAIEKQDQNVEEWYRKTCHGKWSFKPKQLDSEDDI